MADHWQYRLLALAIILSSISCGTEEENRTAFSTETSGTVGPRGIVRKGVDIGDVSGEPCEREQHRKETAEHMDSEGLLYSARVVVDSDPAMLEIPDSMKQHFGSEFTVAETPPEIAFGIVPVEPKFLRVYNNQDESGWWGNYCQSNYYPPTKTFYTGVADHGTYDAHMYLVEYDTEKREIRCLPEVNLSLGKTPDMFGDGILHGWLDFYRSGHLERPHLWFCTYWAKFPEPSEEDYATGYDGGHIVSYDMATREYVDYGAPLPRTSWPYHRVDTKRGMLYAVSLRSEFLAWDIEKQKTIWAGYLPNGMVWYNRSIMLDEHTGCVYTTNAHDTDTERRLIRYDPSKNRFSLLDCGMPENVATGTVDPMRAQTRHRGPDGLIYGVTSTGELFAFDPDNETIMDKGVNWPGDQRYTCTLERSPGGRYVYYQVMSYSQGAPVIQYDTETGTKKVLAFPRSFYYDTYGYIPTGSYSIKLDDDGDTLFMIWNGAFMDYSDDIGVQRWGHCSVMVMEIPESERIE